MGPNIDDYYGWALERIRTEVNETPDEKAITLDAGEWARALIDHYGMEPVEQTGGIEMLEVSRGSYPAIRVFTRVAQTDTLEVISKEGLAGQGAWLGFDYMAFFKDGDAGTIELVVQQEENHIRGAQRQIGEYLTALNNAIRHNNGTFPAQVREIVRGRQQRIKEKDQRLDQLSATLGIPLKKRTDVANVVPTAVSIRKAIAPIIPSSKRAEKRLVLERDKFDAIVSLIDNQGRQFERTPSAFQLLGEESLRDVLLSSLNAVFEGAAVGEAFQGLGKADIHLRISQGEVFISELKTWDGPASLRTVVSQLLDRLTWRDAYGVAIVISKNKDFTEVLAGIERTLPTLPGFVAGSLQQTSENSFMARFSLPSNSSSQVEIHVRGYNLYTARVSGRASTTGGSEGG